MDKVKRSLLLGLTIGDGCICKSKTNNGKNDTYVIHMRHSAKQKSYLTHKRDLLHSTIGGKEPKIRFINNNGYEGVVFSKGSNKHLKPIYNLIYTDGKKTLNRRTLDMLDNQAIALWYMDDGSLTPKKRDNKIHAYDLVISTYLSKEENQIIIDFFQERYNIKFTQVKSKGKYRIRCGTRQARKFIKIVEPYIIPDMEYKIKMEPPFNVGGFSYTHNT